METETPKFRVTQAPGFATGLVMHPPDSEIEWVVPEGWDEKRHGKHFASHGPSLSFVPLNTAAEKLLEAHKAEIKKRNTPKPSADSEHFAKMEQMHLQMMNAVLEGQAENRRLMAKIVEMQEAQGEDEGGKKKK